MPGRHRLDDSVYARTQEIALSALDPTPPYLRYPRAQPSGFTARAVAAAYGAPVDRYDGAGVTVGIISLGGTYAQSDLAAAGLGSVDLTPVTVGGAKMVSDPAADGENALDIQVLAGVAPKARQRVYFAPNTDAGFLAATRQAIAECDAVSISWGGPENSWSAASIRQFAGVLAEGRAKGVPVFVAAGDAGSTDGTRGHVTDYPASDPSVIGCGGTELVVDGSGRRASEVTWNNDPRRSATGGGVSKVFPGRNVPDVAGNADPDTGYRIVVAGRWQVVGGTSAVAPLFAGCYALLKQAAGKPVDFLNLCLTNPQAMFDVTVGDNGGYRAGPGRDNVSGLGVPGYDKLLAILTSGTQVPAPGGNPDAGAPAGGTDLKALLREIAADLAALGKKVAVAVGGGS